MLESTLALAANLARDILNTATSDDEEKQGISEQYQTSAPAAVLPEANGNFSVESSDVPEMEGTKADLNIETSEEIPVNTMTQEDLEMLKSKIMAVSDLSIFEPLVVAIDGENVLVNGIPLEECDLDTLAAISQKV